MIIGITGKSGSGKSTIANYIKELGYEVINVDNIHKEVKYENMDKIKEIFIRHGYFTNDYNEMVSIFFENEHLRKTVDGLLFSETIERVMNKINNHTDKLIFIDAPLLFDMGLNKTCDNIWYVYCDKEVNIQRIMTRNNVTYDEAVSRYNAINFSGVDENSFELSIDTEYDFEKIIKERISKYEESYLCR